MRYLLVSDKDIAKTPHLTDLLIPDDCVTRTQQPNMAFWAPEDHPNMALIACSVSNLSWFDWGDEQPRVYTSYKIIPIYP
jgi:hypothetical protein